jgi:hypothetical protein
LIYWQRKYSRRDKAGRDAGPRCAPDRAGENRQPARWRRLENPAAGADSHSRGGLFFSDDPGQTSQASGGAVMFSSGNAVQVYLAIGATDMRKSINGLSIVIADQLELDPFFGYLFCFCNRRKDIVKILYWHCNGFCLYAEFGIKAIMPIS